MVMRTVIIIKIIITIITTNKIEDMACLSNFLHSVAAYRRQQSLHAEYYISLFPVTFEQVCCCV